MESSSPSCGINSIVHRKVRHSFLFLFFLLFFAFFAENNLDKELEEPRPFETGHRELTVPPEVPGSSNGAGPSDDSTTWSSLPPSGVQSLTFTENCCSCFRSDPLLNY